MAASIRIERPEGSLNGFVSLPTSKSISNRALIIAALGGFIETIGGLSMADDTQRLIKALREQPSTINVENAGTVMRFLCAYLSITPGEWILEGSERMHERPIGPLVESLKSLGAEIEFLGKKDFPPLRMRGKALNGGEVNVSSNTSSQFVSALMLIAPYLKGGLNVRFGNKPASRSYLDMTAWTMARFGVKVEMGIDNVRIPEGEYWSTKFHVPADHSSAGYWAGMVAFSNRAEVFLEGLSLNDPQGDRRIFELLSAVVSEEQHSNGMWLRHRSGTITGPLKLNLASTPDLFPTVAFIFAALEVKAHISGLESLPHKESDRLQAVRTELANIGVEIQINTDYSVDLPGTPPNPPRRPFRTYKDHRMAMCAAMLAMEFGQVEIEDPDVVVKSYPTFWKDLKATGFGVHRFG